MARCACQARLQCGSDSSSIFFTCVWIVQADLIGTVDNDASLQEQRWLRGSFEYYQVIKIMYPIGPIGERAVFPTDGFGMVSGRHEAGVPQGATELRRTGKTGGQRRVGARHKQRKTREAITETMRDTLGDPCLQIVGLHGVVMQREENIGPCGGPRTRAQIPHVALDTN